MEIIFFKVWRNVVLRNEIYKHVRIYKLNLFKSFKSLKEIKEYDQLEYINTLMFCNYEEKDITDELLGCYELRILMIHFNYYTIGINGKTRYPDLLNEISFPSSNETNVQIDNESIPKSIKKVENVYFDNPTINSISDSITFISFSSQFNKCLSTNGYLKNKSNLKTIQFCETEDDESSWNNEETELNIGDIPYGCEILDLGIYQNVLTKNVLPNSITDLTMQHGNQFIISHSIIPNSVRKLNIYSNDYEESSIQFNDYSLPISLSDLTLDSPETILLPNSLNHLISLTKLNIGINFSTALKVGILPNSLENLKISTYVNSFYIEHGALPNKLKSLICNSYLHEYNIGGGDDTITHCSWINNGDLTSGYLPDSITHLEFGNYSNININDVVPLLPNSLSTLVLGKMQKSSIDLNNLPSSTICLNLTQCNQLTDLLNIEENKQILIKR